MNLCKDTSIHYPDIFKKSISFFNSNNTIYNQLTGEMEEELIEKYKHDPEKLKQKLIQHNVFLCIKYARRYINNPEFETIFQNAFLGLCKSAETFDPSRGIKFSTYAFYGIKNHIISEFSNPHNKFIKRNSITLDTGLDNIVSDTADSDSEFSMDSTFAETNHISNESVIDYIEKSEKMKVLDKVVNFIQTSKKLTDFDKDVFTNCCISGKWYTKYARERGVDIKHVRKSMRDVTNKIKKNKTLKKLVKGVL